MMHNDMYDGGGGGNCDDNKMIMTAMVLKINKLQSSKREKFQSDRTIAVIV